MPTPKNYNNEATKTLVQSLGKASIGEKRASLDKVQRLLSLGADPYAKEETNPDAHNKEYSTKTSAISLAICQDDTNYVSAMLKACPPNTDAQKREIQETVNTAVKKGAFQTLNYLKKVELISEVPTQKRAPKRPSHTMT